MEQNLESILDFKADFNVNTLDAAFAYVAAGPSHPGFKYALDIIEKFRAHPDAWTRADAILEYSNVMDAKFIALSILQDLVKFRWAALPLQQAQGIRDYIVNMIINLSKDQATFQDNRLILDKLDLVLVAILKHEWPHNWPTFLSDLSGSSKAADSLAENNMMILKLLSEDIFDFGAEELTQRKAQALKTSLNKEFQLIFQLMWEILTGSNTPSLIAQTLDALHCYLSWIPVGFIFETALVDLLINRFFDSADYRNTALKCLTEIGSLMIDSEYHSYFEKLFNYFMQKMMAQLPPTTDIASAYANQNVEFNAYILNLAQFFSTFFKAHLGLMEKQENQHLLVQGHEYMVRISRVRNEEVFKVCLDYWLSLASDLYHDGPPPGMTPHGFDYARSGGTRRYVYKPILSKIRRLMIERMARPEEVLITADEEGNITRVVNRDKETEVLVLHRTMRDCLVFLTHLDVHETHEIMTSNLKEQLMGNFTWHQCNTLCWAVGSIAGAANEETEKNFLVQVIRELLFLVEKTSGKDNKAVVASCIMYVVGQYPRFLRAHWRFLRTVVRKLFEFMHEEFDGVKDMACDTFLKISQRCKVKFVVPHPAEDQPMPFIQDVLPDIPRIISALEKDQRQTFYEALGLWVNAAQYKTPARTDALVADLFAHPNAIWAGIMSQAQADIEFIRAPTTIQDLHHFLKINTYAARSLGNAYASQLSSIYIDLLNTYKLFSDTISERVAADRQFAAHTQIMKSMRSVKKATIELLGTYFDRVSCSNPAEAQALHDNLLPPLLLAVLADYQQGFPDAREAEVMSLMAKIIDRLGKLMIPEIPQIFTSLIESTLPMITENFEDNPDHRRNFFILLRSINSQCFEAFFMMPPENIKLVMDSIIWAFKHKESDIAETGLSTLDELLEKVAYTDAAGDFFSRFCVVLIQEILYVLTDTFHKAGFRLHATILSKLFGLLQNDQLAAPLWSPDTVPKPESNAAYVRDITLGVLSAAFPNVAKDKVGEFVVGCFTNALNLQVFKHHLRDFLVDMKEFSATPKTNQLLFQEEQDQKRQDEELKRNAIPGLAAQPAVDDTME